MNWKRRKGGKAFSSLRDHRRAFSTHRAPNEPDFPGVARKLRWEDPALPLARSGRRQNEAAIEIGKLVRPIASFVSPVPLICRGQLKLPKQRTHTTHFAGR